MMIIVLAATSQNRSSLMYMELQLKQKLDLLRRTGEDSARLDLSGQFSKDLGAALLQKGSFSYPFDSLKGVSSVTSPDKRLRLYTWPIALENGTYKYFGLLQIAGKKQGPLRVVTLTDLVEPGPDPGKPVLSPQQWYGAVYYQIIPIRLPDKRVLYTLLGWKGVDQLVSSRLIEILELTSDGSVVFGSPLFCEKEKLQDRRLIFRYSAAGSMVLEYGKQGIFTDKKWNAARQRFETERITEKMIVCDHLVPIDPQMEGKFQYYRPSSEAMDGFVLRMGCWTQITGVDARNPSQKRKPLPINPDK